MHATRGMGLLVTSTAVGADACKGYGGAPCADDVTRRALLVRDALPPAAGNGIDYALPPVPPYVGKGDVRLVVVGQDPTVRNAVSRRHIGCALNLDRRGALSRYIATMCAALGITCDNVYATNLFKYFYTVPPADTPEVMAEHLPPNLQLLDEELQRYAGCPVVVLGEPLLQLLGGSHCRMRDYWGYNGGGYRRLEAADNCLHRIIYPFPHVTSLRKRFYATHLQAYLAFMRRDAGME